MTLPRALQALGLRQAPVSKDELRKHFRRMALEAHPDQPTGSNDRMAAVAEAYRYLRCMYDERVGPGARAASCGGKEPKKRRSGAHSLDDVEDVHFVVPGFGRTSVDTWLPWQRQPAAVVGGFVGGGGEPAGRWEASVIEGHLAASKSLDEFVRQVRAAERQRGIFVDGDSAAPKHSSECYAPPPRAHSWYALAGRYYARRLQVAPRTFVMAARYIFMGR